MSDGKYQVTLKFLNKILANLGKEEINDITEFKNIDRLDIISDINKDIFDDMKDEILEHFEKTSINYYQRSAVTSYSLTLLKKMVPQIGYVAISTKKDITERVNNIAYRRTHYFYSIVKK